MKDDTPITDLSTYQPGQLLARGVCRHLRSLDFVSVEELVPTRGLRVDVMALGPKGEVWVIECKSSRADFMSDNKWQGYLEWCDRFFWAVDADFPTDTPEDKLAPARRKVMVQKFARTSAMRLQGMRDPTANITNGLL